MDTPTVAPLLQTMQQTATSRARIAAALEALLALAQQERP